MENHVNYMTTCKSTARPLPYTLNNIGSLKITLQYNHHATPGCRVLLGFCGDCTEGFLLKNLYCLECTCPSLTSPHLNLWREKTSFHINYAATVQFLTHLNDTINVLYAIFILYTCCTILFKIIQLLAAML